MNPNSPQITSCILLSINLDPSILFLSYSFYNQPRKSKVYLWVVPKMRTNWKLRFTLFYLRDGLKRSFLTWVNLSLNNTVLKSSNSHRNVLVNYIYSTLSRIHIRIDLQKKSNQYNSFF